ncbi:hypothetical protein SAMN03097699_2189 [Flavobacteriaceae bacterium MAR_2010_188]|nr:hypothetical protein SAMN03097699_2189 [Flavobacteriaceae bacterium MAR_2010_188]
MFKWVFLLFFISCNTLNAQVQLKPMAKFPLIDSKLIRVDNLGTLFYIDRQNALHKLSDKGNLNYSNIQLGKIYSANAFNDLRINLFYKDFNTIVLLDNRLAEIYKIDLNELEPYKNISHISTGYDTTLWMFNVDSQQLELYDYKSRTTKVTSLPVESNVLELVTDYNYAWLLTENFLYKYNYQGSMISKIKNEGYKTLSQEDENVVLSDGENLFFLAEDSKEIQAIEMPELLIKQFLLTNETLYIYDGEILHQFQLKIK